MIRSCFDLSSRSNFDSGFSTLKNFDHRRGIAGSHALGTNLSNTTHRVSSCSAFYSLFNHRPDRSHIIKMLLDPLLMFAEETDMMHQSIRYLCDYCSERMKRGKAHYDVTARATEGDNNPR